MNKKTAIEIVGKARYYLIWEDFFDSFSTCVFNSGCLTTSKGKRRELTPNEIEDVSGKVHDVLVDFLNSLKE